MNLVVVEGYSILAAAQEVNVRDGCLRDWHRKLTPEPEPCGADATAEQPQSENKRLRKQPREAKIEREILKEGDGVFRPCRTIAGFASQMGSGTYWIMHLTERPMGNRRKTRTEGKKGQVTNWHEHNESLVQRGDFVLWIEEDVIFDWEHPNDETKVGAPFIYSDRAILCLLSLREPFQLAYRQTEGFGRSLVRLVGLEVKIPDYTSLQKRAAKLELLSHRNAFERTPVQKQSQING